MAGKKSEDNPQLRIRLPKDLYQWVQTRPPGYVKSLIERDRGMENAVAADHADPASPHTWFVIRTHDPHPRGLTRSAFHSEEEAMAAWREFDQKCRQDTGQPAGSQVRGHARILAAETKKKAEARDISDAGPIVRIMEW